MASNKVLILVDADVLIHLFKADKISIEIYDMQGKLVLEKKLGDKPSGDYQELLELVDIPQGTYGCRISGQQNMITKQVIKH